MSERSGGSPLLNSGRIDEIRSRFEAAWKAGPCPCIDDFLPSESSGADACFVVEVLAQLVTLDLEKRWELAGGKSGDSPPCRANDLLPARPLLADYLARYPALAQADEPPVELICHEYYVRCRWGDRPTHQQYLDAYGQQHRRLRERLEEEDRELEALGAQLDAMSSGSEQKRMQVGPSEPEKLPESIGRYRIERIVGNGGFGYVYLGHDPSLNRRVAVKVPHAHLVSSPQGREARPALNGVPVPVGLSFRIAPAASHGSFPPIASSTSPFFEPSGSSAARRTR